MKNLLLTTFLMISVILTGWTQTDYLQFELSYMKPKSGQVDMMKKGLAAHAKKYHAADPYKMWVWEVGTGPHSGEYMLALGPATFTQLDNRPSSVEHNADWANNVLAYVESEGETSYWRVDKDLQYSPEGAPFYTKSRLRYVTINPGEMDRWTDQMKKVLEVNKAKKYAAAWTGYKRFGASTGPHACTELNFSNWAYLDTATTFVKDFDEVHGDGAYDRFLDELAIAVDRTKTYDELTTFLPEISSPQQ